MEKFKTKKLGIFSISLLFALFSVITFAPVMKTSAVGSEIEVGTLIRTVLSITTDEDLLSFNLAPLASGNFGSSSVTATVETNSAGGYELYFSSEDNATAMTSVTTQDTITSDFNGSVTSSAMAVNKWAYSLDNTNFSKIPTLDNHVKITDLDHSPSAAEKDTTVNIGIKIDNTISSGVYSKSVRFTAIAHENAAPVQATGIHSITTMQEMTPQICADTTTPLASATTLDVNGSHHGDSNYVPSVTLEDVRDHNTYTIAKLADGKCWMTQNLKIVNKELDSTTSDLPSGVTYTVPASNISAFTTSTSNITAAYYLDEVDTTFYSFYTAAAGWGATTPSSENTPKSICPKGWRLPSGGPSSDSSTLVDTYNSIEALMGAPNLSLAGTVYKGVHRDSDIWGAYWTATSYGSNNAHAYEYYIDVDFEEISLDHLAKYFGFAVRCIARSE